MERISSTLPSLCRWAHTPWISAGSMQCGVILLLLLLRPTSAESRPLPWKYLEQSYRSLGGIYSAGVQVGTSSRMERAVKHTAVNTWPGGIVPYRFIFHEFEPEEQDEYSAKVREAMDWWQDSTCLEFHLVTNETQPENSPLIVKLRNETIKCTALAGYYPYDISRPQTRLFLDMTCLNDVGKIAHEIGHAIGFQHEQRRNDRDEYIFVNLTNIKRNRLHAYSKMSSSYTYYSTPYDLGSIMHYSLINGDSKIANTSVMSLREGVVFPGVIGQRDCLSYYDIKAANLMYNCNRPNLPEVTACNFNKVKFVSTSGLTSGSGVSESDALRSGVSESDASGSGVSELDVSKWSRSSVPKGQSSPTMDPVLVTVTIETPAPTLAPVTNVIPPPTTSPAPSPSPQPHPKYIYPGDILAFKGVPSDVNHWVVCNESTKCFAWGCPGSKFSQTNRQRCEEYKFRVHPVNAVPSSEGLRSGEGVMLQRPHLSNLSSSFLHCPTNGEQCTLSERDVCDCQNVTNPQCQHRHIFKLVSQERKEGKYLRHKEQVMLVTTDNSNSCPLSLACNVTAMRKRKRTCQLETCDVPCTDTRHHFTLYKI